MNRDFYKILIVGGSGKGKTYSLRNLNPDTTGFINEENKPLPFKNKFKYHTRSLTLDDTKKALKEYATNPEINCIVIDSISSFMDKVLRIARKDNKGFEVWNYYNQSLADFFNYIKSIQKEVFITAHYEWIQDEGGAKERRVKVKGKELEGVVEKDFTIVTYSECKFIDKKPEYFFSLVSADSSAKCPPDIFGEGIYSIPNDCNLILEKIIEFTK